MALPSYKEEHISQIPALILLMKMGYTYLTPDEAMSLRGGRESNVILEPILKSQLANINSINYKGKTFPFSESNITQAIIAIRELPIQDGYIKANNEYYDLITLGKSLEQSVDGDKKSFSFRYIDWKNPENNVYHVTEEYSVLRSDRHDTYRPDIVLFVNGIPMVVIECKSPAIKDPLGEAISQHARNQQEEGIRSLYMYSNLVMALCVDQASYATTGTNKEFWGVWKEIFRSKSEGEKYKYDLFELKNHKLPDDDRSLIFKTRYKTTLERFDQMETQELQVTEQDKLIYSLCRKGRLLDIIYHFILYDNGEKKIARYQQYSAIKETLKRINEKTIEGKRKGGVIWHTQGSGKSLTMVMLAQMILLDKSILNPKLVLVTDRIDLNDQITKTFQKCNVEVNEASSGVNLLELLQNASDAVITTIVNKFEAAVKSGRKSFDSTEIFVLVDEGHRSQYGNFNIKMQKIFPNACFIAFTGTPLMKQEKSTAQKFGGIIDTYSIVDAVNDKAVVPLLYEGRHNLIEVNENPLDEYFNMVSEPLTPYGRAALKRKYSTPAQLNKADQLIYARACDIRDHFRDNVQGEGFKAQLVAPNKTTAIKYREYLKEIGGVSCDVLISPPDSREGNEDAYEENDDIVHKFWKTMLSKYGNKDTYEDSIISSFKKQDHPEIIIVVDKLLTGFDAPVNKVLYLTRQLKEHTLLQAIARVNRLAPGKDYGLIIDYYGNIENLNEALDIYSGYDVEEKEELLGTLTNLEKEIEKLPQAHTNVVNVFSSITNKLDEEAYSSLLQNEKLRHDFYEKLSEYARLFKLAMASVEFNDVKNEHIISKHRSELKFYLSLRIVVKLRYNDTTDYKEYEKQIQKLIDRHVTVSRETLKITGQVNIFNKEEREEVLDQIRGKAAKADHIATRTIKAIDVKMKEDPSYYKKLSVLIKETIEAYHNQRIDEVVYLSNAKQYEKEFLEGRQNNVPDILLNNTGAIAFYNLVDDLLSGKVKSDNRKETLAQIALLIDQVILNTIMENDKVIIDWQTNIEVEKALKIALDDQFYQFNSENNINISFEEVDKLIEEVYEIAKAKYK